MSTTSSISAVSAAATRGDVQKTFVKANILSGFADPNHFGLLANEYLSGLSQTDRDAVLAAAGKTREFVSKLPALAPQQTVIRDITGGHVDAIRADPLFGQFFGALPHRFCYINPSSVIALQAWIEPRSDRVPTEDAALLEFALPRKWDTPAEVSFIAPMGPIQILSSSPVMQHGLAIELDPATQKVFLGAPKHINLVQVKHFQGRLFLQNGYHRVADAIKAGCKEFPALVVEAFQPEQVAVPGAGTFNIGYVLSQQRPPLVADFRTAAALDTQVRERRYGVIVSLDFKPINFGI